MRSIALVLIALGMSGCVTEAYNSQARADAKTWIGRPIQEMIRRTGEPQEIRGDSSSKKYIWKNYAAYSVDYAVIRQESGHGPKVGTVGLYNKSEMANKSGYYTCITEYDVDAAGLIVGATARGECR